MPNLTKRRRQLRELSQRTAANRRRASHSLSIEGEHDNENDHEENEEGDNEEQGSEQEHTHNEEEEEQEEQQEKHDEKTQPQEEEEEEEETRARNKRTRTHTAPQTVPHTQTRAHTYTHAHTHAEEESAGEESAAHSASSARSSVVHTQPHTRKRTYTRRENKAESERHAHTQTQAHTQLRASAHSTSHNTHTSTNTNNGVSAAAESDERAWVQCNDCGKWRALPATVDAEALPEIWTCAMNTYDPLRNKCDAPEENYSKDEEPEQNVPLKAFLRLWMNKMYFAERAEKTAGTVTRARKRKQDVDWIQCSNPACGKWRSIAKGIETAAMLKKLHKRRAMGEELHWFCTMNSWDDSQASCTAPQEPLWDCPWNLTAEDD